MNKINRVTSRVLLATLVVFVAIFGFNSVASADDNITFSAELESSLAISVPTTSPSLTIRPSSSGTPGSTTFTVNAYTNDSVGYKLSMSVSSTTDLTSENDDTIPTLESNNNDAGYALNSIPVNHWGIAIGNGSNYFPASTTSEEIKVATGVTGVSGDSTIISLGARLDLETVPGSYTTTLNFTITANVVTPPAP